MKYLKTNGEIWEEDRFSTDYSCAHAVGALRIGDEAVYFRAKRKTYAIPYTQLDRFYRRVVLVPARMCCGKGDLAVEYLVFEENGEQLAQVQMPGERAGKAALEELKTKAPHAAFTCPPKAGQGADPQ